MKPSVAAEMWQLGRIGSRVFTPGYPATWREISFLEGANRERDLVLLFRFQKRCILLCEEVLVRAVPGIAWKPHHFAI